MIQHTKKMKKIIYVLFLLLNLSCKSNTEKSEKNNSLTDVIDTTSTKKEKNKESILVNGEKYIFYRAYYHQADENDIPEIYEDKVVEKFKDMKVKLSKDIISIDGTESHYTIEKMDSRKFFMRKYLYNYYVDAFKNGFEIDINKNVDYLQLDLSNNTESPFKDYFLDAGTTVFTNNCLFLNFKRYIICFKKEDRTKVWDTKNCELPFDFGRLNKVFGWCTDDKNQVTRCSTLYPELVKNEYPIFYFRNNKELEKMVVKETKIASPNHYFNIKTNLKDIHTIVVCYPSEESEESQGPETYLMNIKNNKVISYIKDEKNDDFINFKDFVIDENLNITFYEINGLRPKEKIFRVYKMNTDGTFVKIR